MGRNTIYVELSCKNIGCCTLIKKSVEVSVTEHATPLYVITKRNDRARKNNLPVPFRCPVCYNSDPKLMVIRILDS